MPWFRQTPTWDSPHLGLGKIRTWSSDWLTELQQNKTSTGETPWNILRSWPYFYSITSVSILQILGGHAGIRIRRANLPLSPLDLGGAATQGQRSATISMPILDLVRTENYMKCTILNSSKNAANNRMYASCFLRLLAKGTSKLCEVGQRSSIFLPGALRISACGYERIDAATLHWDPEDASCTAPPKSAADACEDVDGNDVGLCVAVLSRLGSRNLNAPGTSLLLDRTHTCKITSN